MHAETIRKIIWCRKKIYIQKKLLCLRLVSCGVAGNDFYEISVKKKMSHNKTSSTGSTKKMSTKIISGVKMCMPNFVSFPSKIDVCTSNSALHAKYLCQMITFA